MFAGDDRRISMADAVQQLRGCHHARQQADGRHRRGDKRAVDLLDCKKNIFF